MSRSSVIDVSSALTADLTKEAARELTDKITRSVVDTFDLVAEAYGRRAWAALGYATWKQYVAAEFEQIALPKDERQSVIGALRAAGMSTRAIAVATGVDPKTVRNNLSGGENPHP